MPISIVGISVLLWVQGLIWGSLGGLFLLYLPAYVPASGLISAVCFGFTALSWILGALLLRRGSERARTGAIAQESFITFLGLAILGTWIFTLDEFADAAPIAGFAFVGVFLSACAVAGLLGPPVREFCHPRTASD